MAQWHLARGTCWDMGGDLVRFQNVNEHLEVLREASRLNGNPKIYIGLYRGALTWKRGEYKMIQH
jgi:hypothetical protein